MKHILLLLLLIPGMNSSAQFDADTVLHKIELNLPKQKAKFFHKADVAVYSLFFFAGAAEGFNDVYGDIILIPAISFLTRGFHGKININPMCPLQKVLWRGQPMLIIS